MNRKLGLIVPIIGALAISACTSTQNNGNPQDGDQKPSPTQNETQTPDNTGAAGITPERMPEPVELTTFKSVSESAKLPPGDTVENNQYTRYLKDKANITFKLLWYASGSNYDEKMKLSLASNDIPDMLIVKEDVFKELADAGQLEDLTGIYDQYASQLTKELHATTDNLALKKATYDGKLLGIPNISVQADSVSMLFIRQDWLDQLNLDPPETVDDVVKIAKAFVEADLAGGGNTIGLTGSPNALSVPQKASHHNYKAIFQAYNAYPTNWIKDASGEVVYGSIQPETKEALGKIREMYADGLIDREFLLRNEPHEPVISGRAGMFFGPWWSAGVLKDTYTNFPDAEFVPYLIKDAQGQINNMKMPVSERFVIARKGIEHPEAAMVYVNTYVAAERRAEPDSLNLDTSVSTEYWPIGNATFDYADAVERKSDTLQQALNGEIKPDELLPEMKKLYDNAVKDRENPRADLEIWRSFYGYTAPSDLLKQDMNELYNEFTGVTRTMERRWVNLQKLESETFSRIVIGELPLDAFDTFVSDWKAQGGDIVTEEVREEIKKSQ